MKTVLPIILILVSVGLFTSYLQPTWEDVLLLREQDEEFNQALADVKEVENIVATIVGDYRDIPLEDLDDLDTFLPTSVDSGRLLLDVDNLADKHDVTAIAIGVVDNSEMEMPVPEGEEAPLYRQTTLQFEVSADYENFLGFLFELEQSLQLMDITNLKISASDVGGLETYTIDITVYAFNK